MYRVGMAKPVYRTSARMRRAAGTSACDRDRDRAPTDRKNMLMTRVRVNETKTKKKKLPA